MTETITLKHTVSVKQRSEVGDEVFISVGAEVHGVALGDADATQSELNARIDEWLSSRVESVAGAAFGAVSDEVADEPDEGDETEDESDEESELTPEIVEKMKVADLNELIEEYELDVDPKLTLKAKRAAIIEALFDDGDEDDDEADENEDESESEESEDEGEYEPYTEDELQELSLKELIEIADDAELEVDVKKDAKLKEKKAAYIEAILEYQEE